MSTPTATETEIGAGQPRSRTRSNTFRAVGLAVCVAVLFGVMLLSVWIGTKDIPFAAVWDVLLHNDGSSTAIIIHSYRIPRTLLALLIGAALGLSGALLQALTRNPLADPGLLGINLGAASGVVIAIAFVGVGTVLGYVWFAFAGAAVASVVVYLLSSAGRSAATPDRLVLAGAALTAVLYAFNSAILLLNPRAFDAFRFWQVGSLAGRHMDVLLPVLPFILAGIVLALALVRPLNALALGEQLAGALGARVGRTRVFGAIAVTLLCGAATAAAGPIGFVGLAVPHMARLIVGPDQRWLLPYSALLAPILLLVSDIIGRTINAPAEVEVGIVTAFLGAPVFLALCRRRRLATL